MQQYRKELDQKRGIIEAIEWTVLIITLHIGLALVVDSWMKQERNYRMKR